MPGFLATFIDKIYEPTQLLLITVGVLYALFGGVEEAITALVVIILMANVSGGPLHQRFRRVWHGVPGLVHASPHSLHLLLFRYPPQAEIITEWRAKQALAKLKQSVPRFSTVVRAGETMEINATQVVPGDIVLLRPGMVGDQPPRRSPVYMPWALRM